ncbi:MAG: helix-turn-helix transcriptional regulator [Polyangiales bacterium]
MNATRKKGVSKERSKSEADEVPLEVSAPPREDVTLGGTLRAIRKGDELSQNDFAAKLDLSAQKLCDIEKGRRSVSPKRAAGWARTLGQSEAQFVRLALQAKVDQGGLKFMVQVAPLE